MMCGGLLVRDDDAPVMPTLLCYRTVGRPILAAAAFQAARLGVSRKFVHIRVYGTESGDRRFGRRPARVSVVERNKPPLQRLPLSPR
jgi:hypothetical protein